MARSAKPKTVHQDKRNDLATKAKPYLDQIERIEGEMEERKSAYMTVCKGLREEIKETIEAAVDAGVNKKALKGIVKARKLEKKIRAIDADFDIDEAAQFDALAAAFGEDSPFGRHAKQRADEVRHPGNEVVHPEADGQPSRPDEEHLSRIGRGSDAEVVDELAH